MCDEVRYDADGCAEPQSVAEIEARKDRTACAGGGVPAFAVGPGVRDAAAAVRLERVGALERRVKTAFANAPADGEVRMDFLLACAGRRDG